MSKQQIGLLFGVKGQGNLSGESGQLILQQLNKIARSIDNTNNRVKVTIGVNEAQNSHKKDIYSSGTTLQKRFG